MVYPKKARRKGISGKAYISFSIDKHAKVTDVTIVRSSGNELLDEAAIDVISSIPDLYQPATQKGKAVKVKFTLPIGFKLD